MTFLLSDRTCASSSTWTQFHIFCFGDSVVGTLSSLFSELLEKFGLPKTGRSLPRWSVGARPINARRLSFGTLATRTEPDDYPKRIWAWENFIEEREKMSYGGQMAYPPPGPPPPGQNGPLGIGGVDFYKISQKLKFNKFSAKWRNFRNFDFWFSFITASLEVKNSGFSPGFRGFSLDFSEIRK